MAALGREKSRTSLHATGVWDKATAVVEKSKQNCRNVRVRSNNTLMRRGEWSECKSEQKNGMDAG